MLRFQGDIVLRVHAEDGDKGVPREIVYGLVSEGNPFTPFFNISEATGKEMYHGFKSNYCNTFLLPTLITQ